MDNQSRDAVFTKEEISNEEYKCKTNLGNCKNRSVHSKQFSVEHFKIEKLPKEFQNSPLEDLVTRMTKLTVRLHYSFQENDKHKFCLGSGFVQRVIKKNGSLCPCQKCSDSSAGQRETTWFKLMISSASCVFSRFDSNAKKYATADIEFRGYEEIKRKVSIFKVECDKSVSEESDWCVCFGASHDQELCFKLMGYLDEFEALQKNLYQWHRQKENAKDLKLMIIVGYPNRGHMKISILESYQREHIKDVGNGQALCRYTYGAVTCPGSSGSPLYICGQPISGFGYWFGHPHIHARGSKEKGLSCTGKDKDLKIIMYSKPATSTKDKYFPDVEIIIENNQHLQSRFEVCPKEKYHKDFISIVDFETDPWRFLENKFKAIDDLPEFLKCMSALTGQIIVERDGRPVVGSGFIHKIRRGELTYCPCHECLEKQETKKQVYGILTVTTVIHNFVKKLAEAIKTGVFSENWEPKNTKVRLFYDEENEENKTFIYGYKLLETDKEIDIHSDWCSVECVTHDMVLVQELEAKLDKYMELQGEIYRKSKGLSLNDLVIIVGHPHGGPKMISVGSPTKVEILKEVRNYQKWCRYQYDNITCRGNSGSPICILGQPLCGFGYWFGHPHNHSKGLHEKAKGGCSSVGVENVVI